MDIVNRCPDRVRLFEIAVVTRAFLPETKCGDTRSLPNSEFTEQSGVCRFKQTFDSK